MLKTGDVALLAVVSLQLVQDLHENFEDWCRVITAYAVELLIDVEQDAPRWNGSGLAEIGLHDLVFDFRQNDVGRTNPVGKWLAVEDEGKNFEQVRFTRAKESRDPHPICRQFGEVTIRENAKSPGDIAGDHILLKLGLEVASIIGLDDAINRAFNRFKEEFVYLHEG